MGFGSSKTTKSNNTSTTSIDPQLRNRQNTVYDRGIALADQPYQPFTGQRFEDFNRDQTNSFQAARDAVGAGQDTLGNAIGTANNLAGFNGQTVTPQQAQQFTAAGPSQVAGQQIGANQFGPDIAAKQAGARDVAARTGAAGFEQFMNPFTQNVVDTSLGDIERSRQDATNATRSQAAAAGAFGGSRSGVAESLTNRDFGDTAARTAAGLRQAGFTQALGFNQADQDRELRAGMSNQGADVSTGIANANNSLQAGISNRNTGLQAALANQSTDLTGQLANQQAGAQNAQFNAGQLQAGSQFNSNLDLQGQQSNQASANQAAGLRLGAAGLQGQFASQQQQMGAAGADLLSRIGGQQQAFGQANRDFGYQQFNEERNLPYQNLDMLRGITEGQRFNQTTNSQGTVTEENKAGLGSSILSAASTAAGIAAGVKKSGGGGGGPQQIYNPGQPIFDPSTFNRPFGQGR